MKRASILVVVPACAFLLMLSSVSGRAAKPPAPAKPADEARPAAKARPAAQAVPSEPATITFFVASDSHFGAKGMTELNRLVVDQMNGLAGTAYPPEIGGQVAEPRGLLFLGDTTDNGEIEEFAEFEKVYGLNGKDGLLHYPVFEAIGNHDLNSESPIKPRVEQRHGAIDYSWDWDDLHIVCLDMYPDAGTLQWLARDLAPLDPGRPLVLYFHYSIEGNYSNSWTPAEKAAFARAIEGRNVLAIFHGHEHRVGHYVWHDLPVFRPGAPRHSSHTFLAVRVGQREMTVAAWDFDHRAWHDSWTVPVRRGASVETTSSQ
jgi:cytolysin (calcineurin-like family phosphatase)